jgi:dihydroorotate dehydrogenase (fumarate)
MGMELENPIIVASSVLTSTKDKVAKCEEAGAGAVVLKSIFEEQIMHEVGKMMDESQSTYHPEALDYIDRIGSYHTRQEYLDLIKDAKDTVSIPVIASLNCVGFENWIDYAGEVEKAGADGIELNLFIIPKDPRMPSSNLEENYIKVIKAVKKQVSIPVAVKISPFFTNMIHFADQMEANGVSALVMFNRYYHFDINIDKIELTHGSLLSHPIENALTLRWLTLLSGRFKFDIVATTGIQDGTSIIKQILAGADAVQMASVLYKNGVDAIGKFKEELSKWMDTKGFGSISDFKGKLSQAESDNPMEFERFQYIKGFVGVE